MLADSAMLKLDYHNNGWKGVCVYQHGNGGKFMCGVCYIGSRYCYICKASGINWAILLSAYWDARKNCCDITDEDICRNVKFAAT